MFTFGGRPAASSGRYVSMSGSAAQQELWLMLNSRCDALAHASTHDIVPRAVLVTDDSGPML